jgi:hypothetical protein
LGPNQLCHPYEIMTPRCGAVDEDETRSRPRSGKETEHCSDDSDKSSLCSSMVVQEVETACDEPAASVEAGSLPLSACFFSSSL